MALIRYPGSKEKLADTIWQLFPTELQLDLWMRNADLQYREPFFGAGAMGFRILDFLSPNKRVWINDIDPGMVSLWTSIRDHSSELMKLISAFKPSTEYFYKFKEEDGRTDLGVVRQGFRKLALHRMSYSGLGCMSGGPLGGKKQSSAYNVDCRWNPEKMKADVSRLSRILRKFDEIEITCGDFAPLIRDERGESFIYADPPYYKKGGQLYKHNMSHKDHQRLCFLLRETKAKWVLSYDEHETIREMYSWASFHEIKVTYTMAKSTGDKRPKNKEVAITPL